MKTYKATCHFANADAYEAAQAALYQAGFHTKPIESEDPKQACIRAWVTRPVDEDETIGEANGEACGIVGAHANGGIEAWWIE
jgi:hypothetical protein